MYTVFIILHLIVAVILILVVLLQSGKAGDLSTAFGGGSSQTAFGSRSAATLITKATAVAAGVFMVTSMGLSIMSSSSVGSVMQDVPVAGEEATSPETPETPPAQTPPPPSEPPSGETSEPATSKPPDQQ